MKNFLLIASMVFSLSALANIDEGSAASVEPTATELKASRACFAELETQGCGHPRDDQEHFESCLNNVYSSLSSPCKSMMTGLYGIKK